MSYEIPGDTRSYEAVADLSASFFKFVKLTGATLAAVTSATDNALGVLQNKPNRPQSNLVAGPGYGLGLGGERSAGTVMISGVSRVVAGAAFAAGVPLTIDTQGRVVSAGAGARVVGLAEEGSTGANAIVSVLLKPLGGVVV